MHGIKGRGLGVEGFSKCANKCEVIGVHGISLEMVRRLYRALRGKSGRCRSPIFGFRCRDESREEISTGNKKAAESAA